MVGVDSGEGMPNDDELTQEQAAAQLGVGVKTLINYRERGLIEARVEPQGLNTRYWYTPAAVEACRQRLAELREQR